MISVNHNHKLFWKFIKDFFHHFGDSRYLPWYLHCNTVTGRDGTNQRHEWKLERIVPWRENEHLTVWLGSYIAESKKVHKRGPDILFTGPFSESANRKINLLDHKPCFGCQRFKFRLMKILPQSIYYFLFILDDQLPEFFQNFKPVTDIQGFAFSKKSLLAFQYLIYFFWFHSSSRSFSFWDISWMWQLSFGSILFIAYSAIAVMVRLGFTPMFPWTTDPSVI